MKRFAAFALTLWMIASLVGCGSKIPEVPEPAEAWPGAVTIQLYEEGDIGVNAQTQEQADGVTTAHDIVYYEEGKDFTYGEGTAEEAHSPEEAEAHTVVHITRPGTYVLQGTLSRGQIAVDLGEGAEEDPEAVVTLVLNGVDINCDVAPAVIFYNVYECGSTDTETATKDVDTSAAGANVVIADGTTNVVTGSHVARIYKPETVELSEDGTEVLEAKKLHKYDAAFYSKMSMNVSGGEVGDGVLKINADNEGLDSELHLTVSGGVIRIESGNDGINTNEDGVSVTTINGGYLDIHVTGETGEGDGIDSNGWLVINGGTVMAAACANSMDSGIDSDIGIHINGGTVLASGHMLDAIEAGGQTYAVFSFGEMISADTTLTLRDESGADVLSWTCVNACSNLVVSMPTLTAGDYTLWQGDTQLAHSGSGGMMGFPGMGGGFRPDGMEPPQGFDPGQQPGGMEFPEGFDPSQFEMGQMPEGMEFPGGFDPAGGPGGQFPEGGFTPLDGGMMGFPGMGGETGGELSEIFAIPEGGTVFNGVTPLK